MNWILVLEFEVHHEIVSTFLINESTQRKKVIRKHKLHGCSSCILSYSWSLDLDWKLNLDWIPKKFLHLSVLVRSMSDLCEWKSEVHLIKNPQFLIINTFNLEESLNHVFLKYYLHHLGSINLGQIDCQLSVETRYGCGQRWESYHSNKDWKRIEITNPSWITLFQRLQHYQNYIGISYSKWKQYLSKIEPLLT